MATKKNQKKEKGNGVESSQEGALIIGGENDFDSLLNGLKEEDLLGALKEKPLQRASDLKYEANFQRFILAKMDYAAQYAPLYFARLKLMKPWLQTKAAARWGKKKGGEGLEAITSILELKESEKCYVVGTLFKEMPLKPSVLADYAKERAIIPPPIKESYVSPNDRLVLEDESGGRVFLIGVSESALPVSSFVSGMVVAVKGKLIAGDFEVEELCLPDFAPQPTKFSPKASKAPRLIAIVSGLNIGSPSLDMLPVQLLFNYLSGYAGSKEEHEFQANIQRVIIAGNSFHESISTPIDTSNSWRSNQIKIDADKANQEALAAMSIVDRLITHLASSVPIDLMAGATDPSNFNLPQQPLNPCIFPQSYVLSSFKAVTNPYEFKVDGLSVLGTSGQPIDNIYRYITPVSRLQCLEDTLRWRHLAPTAPDTLGCYPFEGTDPFAMKECPHIYFAANQPEFDTKLVKGSDGQVVRLIISPSFHHTKTISLVDVDTLECYPMKFEV